MQRLTYNSSPNEVKGLYIDESDELLLAYQQWWFDSLDWTWLDTLFLMTKEKNGEWSQPEVIGNPSLGMYYVKSVGYDPHADVIHLFYDCGYSSHCGDTLYYTNSSVPNWETVKTDTGSDRVHVGSMAFDTLGNIHLLWNVDYCSTSCNWYKVMYANNSTGEWVKQQVSPPIWLGGMGSGGVAGFDVQKNGTAHIVYQGEPYCDTECVTFYTRNDGLNSSNWITDTVPKPPRTLWHYGGGPLKLDVNETVHLITGGCIEEDCVWPGLKRHFYYSKQAEDSLWQGPETLPDTTFGIRVRVDQLLIDEEGIPYASYFFSSNEVYFTDRRQRSWEVAYGLVGWHGQTPDSFMVDAFCFVLDSEGKGHGAFSAFNFAQGTLEDDSVEIYYISSYSSEVDTETDDRAYHFNLIQNYPNPFNSTTMLSYEIKKGEHVGLRIYDILGREVRELVKGEQKEGCYRVAWDGRNNQGKEVTSGIYFCELQAGDYKQTRKLVLIR